MEGMNGITSTQRQIALSVVAVCFAFALFFLWGKVNVYAEESPEGYNYYEYNSEDGNREVVINGYNRKWSDVIDKDGTLTLPSTIDGKKVTRIAWGALSIWGDVALKKVQLPDYLAQDGYGASI